MEVSDWRNPEPFQETARPSVRPAVSPKESPAGADTLKARDACTREIAPPSDEAMEKDDRPDESLAAMVTRRELESFPGDWLNQLESDEPEEPLYAECMAFVLHSLQSVQNGQNPKIESGRELAERLVEGLQTDSALLLEATNREQPYSVSAHSVNVAILSIPLCAAVEFERERTVTIVLAGLLHEVGVAFLPEQLMHLQARVSETELRLLRFRAKMSARVLERLGPQYEDLAAIVGQIFEREDGSGFPSGLKGEEIREEAKALGLIDVFEACIHPRNHRAALSGYDTLFALTTDPAPSFPERLLRGLVRAFSLYPYNEIVVLNSGERGRVVRINPESLSRPVVQLLSDAFGRTLNEAAILDLSAHPSRYVAQTLGARLTD
jgi:HD-GYP domain-containing protein (c-di-GMP phosphodiesterase class II)